MQGMSRDVVNAARLAACAELAWRDADGGLHAIAFTPLVIDGAVVAALPFDRTDSARSLAAATSATVVVSDSRMALKGWAPWAQPVRLKVTADRAGDWTWTGALDQEVRKYPPSRLLIDTPIQRREHWWYVPRWLVRLQPAGHAEPIARRSGPDDAVAFDVGSDGLRAWTAAVDDWQATQVQLTALDQTAPLGERATALVFTHDFSIPDMERWASHELIGVRNGRRLAVATRRGRPTVAPTEGLVQRLSRHWRRERGCRRALASYDADSSVAAM
jgi:hypothetical protein